MKWNPSQYLKFAEERFRPARDLISHIPLQSPALICDLGCGTGHLTMELAEQWPDSKIIGLDSSEEMLQKANELTTKIHWEKANIEEWAPAEKFDLIFSNSVLHWLDSHEEVFQKLLAALKLGGILAIQMPNNFKEPTHTSAFKIINGNPQWKVRFLPFLNHEPIKNFEFYYKLFSKSATTLDAWQTTYFHILNGKNPVVEWVKGSFLKPLLDQMNSNEKVAFLEEYSQEISRCYPEQQDGKTILPFKRIFFIVTKS